MIPERKDSMAKWFFRYEGGQCRGGFDIRRVLEWHGEPDFEQIGYRVYVDNGKSHWLTEGQLGEMIAMMERLS